MSDETAARADEASALPADLRLALVCWWRAYHHGGQKEEQEAEEMLCAAINPRIEAMRRIEYGGRRNG